MNYEPTRPSLLSRVRDPADNEAWAEFDARYRDLIFRYCRRRGLSAADAEDVRQIVMIRLVRVLPGFHYDPLRGRFHDYLYRMVHTSISDYRACPESRRHAVLHEGDADDLACSADPPEDDVWEQEWLDHHLRIALARVRQTSDQRSIEVFEKLLCGISVEEAANEFGLTTDAVHKIKQRIRDRVQQRIEEQIREENSIEAC